MFGGRRVRQKTRRKKAEKQLGDEEVYEEVPSNTAPLLKTINSVIAKIRKRDNPKRDNLHCFIINKICKVLSPN